MECSEFWKRYDDSGMNPDLDRHLAECPSCSSEYIADSELEKTVSALPGFSAPDGVFDRIMADLDETPVDTKENSVIKKSRGFFTRMLPHSLPLIPAAAGFAAVLIAAVWLTFFITRTYMAGHGDMMAEEHVPDLKHAEETYFKALDKYLAAIEASKDDIDPELYDSYREKLAVLDMYIMECREAVEENEFNSNARRYLAMAYMEKARTLKEMAKSAKG